MGFFWPVSVFSEQKDRLKHQKIYKDILNDHFTQNEQREMEPYTKIHSKLDADHFLNVQQKLPVGILMMGTGFLTIAINLVKCEEFKKNGFQRKAFPRIAILLGCIPLAGGSRMLLLAWLYKGFSLFTKSSNQVKNIANLLTKKHSKNTQKVHFSRISSLFSQNLGLRPKISSFSSIWYLLSMPAFVQPCWNDEISQRKWNIHDEINAFNHMESKAWKL